MALGWGQAWGAGAQGMASFQMLRDQLAQYPDLLAAQLKQQQNSAGIGAVNLQYAPQMAQANLTNKNLVNQWYPQTQQADINSKNAYTANAPYQASAMLSGDPYTQMMYDKTLMQRGLLSGNGQGSAMPPITSTDGGMTVQPAAGLGAPSPAIMPSPQGNQSPLPQGVPYASPGQISTGNTGGGVPTYPTLPGGIPPSLPQAAQQVNAGPSGLGAPAPGMPDYNTMMALRMRNMMLSAGKNPTMGSNRSGAGGTYIDPMTGQQISTDTSQQTTRDQRTIAGLQNAQQYLGNVIQQMPQFVTGWQKASLAGQGLANSWGGANFQGPSNYATAQASLKSAAEGVINGFGLNATGENVQTVLGIMKPDEGESPQYYQQRVINQLADFSDQEHRATGRLAGGIPVGNAPQQAQQTTANPAMSFDLPSFKNQSEFQGWYKGLTGPEQDYVKTKLAAQK